MKNKVTKKQVEDYISSQRKKYKGKCILHDWEYKFEYSDYWKYTGSFLKSKKICL